MRKSIVSIFLMRAFVVETTANDKLIILKVAWEFMRLNGKSFRSPFFDSEIIVDVEKGLFRPLATTFMFVHIFHVAHTKLRRNMEQFMLLNSFLIIDQITVGTFLDHLHPSAVWFVLFFGRMTAAASKRVMFNFDSLLSSIKSLLNFFTVKNVTIKVFTKNLSRLIFDCILRIN